MIKPDNFSTKIKRLCRDNVFRIWSIIAGIFIVLALLWVEPKTLEARALIALMLLAFIWGWLDGHNILCLTLNTEKQYFNSLKSIFDDRDNDNDNDNGLFTDDFSSSIDNIMNLFDGYDYEYEQATLEENGNVFFYHGNYSYTHLSEVLERTKKSKTISDTDSIEYLSNIRRDDIHMRLIHVRFIVWVIPTLGFIGTLLGMRNGLDTLKAALESKEGVKLMAESFSTAFDATLFAIALSAILAFLLSCIEKQSDAFLVSMDNYLVNDILKRLPNPLISDFERQMKDFEAIAEKSSGILESTVTTLKQAVESISRASQPMVTDTLTAGATLKQDMAEIANNMKAILVASNAQINVVNQSQAKNTADLLDIATAIRDHLSRIDSHQQQAFTTLTVMESHIKNLSGTLPVSLDAEQINGFISSVMEDINSIHIEARKEYAALLGLQDGDEKGNTLLGIMGEKLDAMVYSVNTGTTELSGIGEDIALLKNLFGKLSENDVSDLLSDLSQHIKQLDENTNNILASFKATDIKKKLDALLVHEDEKKSELKLIIEELVESRLLFKSLNDLQYSNTQELFTLMRKIQK